MQLFLDAVLRPLPPWTPEMLAEHPPAKVADFAARFASELARNEKRWVTDVSPDGSIPLSRVAVIVCASKPISEVSHNVKSPARAALSSAKELHARASSSLRGGFAKLAAEELEAVQAYWSDVCASLDTLAAMGDLPTVFNPDALEGILGRLEQSLGTDAEQAANCVDELGVLAEQWSAALDGSPVGRN